MTLKEYCLENNLLHFLDEWADENGSLTPAMVLSTSNVKVWWNCAACGRMYQEPIAKHLLGMNCPNCRTKNVKPTLKKKPPKTDLVGQNFGRLMVLSCEGVSKNTMWRCKCECGQEIVVAQNRLTGGNTTSCGCKQEEVRKENFKNNIHFVEGTCIERIAAKTTPSNNTSGFRGVTKRPNGRYRAGLTFKGKRYDLGTYSTLEKAIEARLAGEIMMDEFVENFKNARNMTYAETLEEVST